MMLKELTPPQKEMLDLCSWAFVNGYSDLHIEPTANGGLIRGRKNGLLNDIKSISKEKATVFFENAKSLLNFNMALSGVPQDSRYSHPVLLCDYRCNLMPVLFGEKICLRLLERSKEFHLVNYNLPDEAKIRLLKILEKGQGLIIVSGPTGSGKTTLLYSALGSIDRNIKNINTIEDPVEYTIEKLNQIPVQKGKYEFSDALRALMRQDPDVIMVGEIRDSETAEAAVHAASTGHLVLTTVHANDANDIFTRLQGLGVPIEPVKLALQFASAQRLVKILCPHCKEDDLDSIGLIKEFFQLKEINFTPKIATGCEQCISTGVLGRELIFEYIVPERISGKRELVAYDSLQNQAFKLLQKGAISAKEAYSCFAD